MDNPPVTTSNRFAPHLALAADDGMMIYWKMMLWLAIWMAGVPLVFSAIIAAIYIFTGPGADPVN
jgi:hypothetical protein